MFFPVLLLAAALATGAPQPAQAQAARSDSVYLEELTSTEVRERVRSGHTTVLVPVGGTEQNGPHLVLGKHNVRVKVLAGRIAESLGDALVAPVLAYVPEGSIEPPAGHMRFSGTVSVPAAVFESTLEHAARSFRRHGFRDVVLIGDHGGYQASLGRVAGRLNREWAAGSVRVHAVLDYYRAADVDFRGALRRQGFGEDEIGTHAGLADTALSMAIDPRLVRADRLQEAASASTGGGVSGDPRRATAALGQAGAELIVTRTRDAIRRESGRR